MLMLANYYYLLLIVAVVAIQATFFQKHSKVQITLRYVQTCQTEKNTNVKVSVYLRRYNQTNKAVDINVTILETFDDTYDLQVEMWKWGDGGWKKNFVNANRNYACTSLDVFMGPIWKRILQNVHADMGCPVAPGFYHVTNLTMASGAPQGSLFVFPGKFYVAVRVTKNRKVHACVEFEIDCSEMIE